VNSSLAHLAQPATVIDSCIGIDPGPATGICFLDYRSGVLAGRTLLQSEGATAMYVIQGLLDAYYPAEAARRRIASVERFVTGAGAGSRGKNADVTRQLVMELAEVLQGWGYTVKLRNAGEVKPWATDKRLQAAGIVTGPVHGDMNHAYDAARHALFGAVETGVTPDPLIGKRQA